VVGSVPEPAPREVAGGDIGAARFQGELVATRMARVIAVEGGVTRSYLVTFRAADGSAFVVRVDGRVGDRIARGDWEPGAGYDLTGVLGTFDHAPQLKPRGPEDVRRVAAPLPPEPPRLLAVRDARALADGERVAVDGVVTAGHRQFRNQGDNIYLQDATGGIQVFGGALDPLRLAIGDSIRVEGILDTWHERQVASPVVQRLGTGTVPPPLVLDASAFNSLAHEGALVRIRDVTVLRTGALDDQRRYNVFLRDDAGRQLQLRIEGGVADLFPPAAWPPGARFHVTGILGQFGGTAQLKVRLPEDVEPAA
jgi:hypothetical protein